ncbi:MAG: YlxR family protein [Acidimicrobiia bacterium]
MPAHSPNASPSVCRGEVRGPRRTCVGCRRVTAPSELWRIVRRTDGELLSGRGLAGRGAWVCAASRECFEEAVRRRALARSLRAQVTTAESERLRVRLFG